MSIYDKKIESRLHDIRQWMNAVKVDDQFNMVNMTLYDIKPKVENLLSYMKSVGVDPDTSQHLFEFLWDICSPLMWDRKGYRKTDAKTVEWTLILCQEHSLDHIAWRLYNSWPELKRVGARPYLPEHLQSAAKIMQ